MPATGVRRSSDTRDRIIAISRELFARQGYTATSVSDIARHVGTTTAALYYHFSSKADILDALFADPLAGYARFVERLGGDPSPEDVLSAVLELTTAAGGVIQVIGADPSVMRMLEDRMPFKPQQMIDEVIAVLAGPDPDRAAYVAAHAAYAVIKEASHALIRRTGVLTEEDHAQLLAAALRALDR